MEKKFITPVSMKVTKEQFEADLREPLEGMGYGYTENHNKLHYVSGGLLYNSSGSIPPIFRLIHGAEMYKESAGSYFIDHYNPKLFLALAAMTEGKKAIAGEWVKDTSEKPVVQNMMEGCALYWKASKEELIEYFTQPQSNSASPQTTWVSRHTLSKTRSKV